MAAAVPRAARWLAAFLLVLLQIVGSVELGEPGCDDICPLEGINATCRARILWTADHEFKGRTGACALAYTVVAKQCSTCSRCIPANVCDIKAERSKNATGFKAAGFQAAARAATVAEGCAVVCEINGMPGTCHDRVRWASHHEFKSKPRAEACRAAHHLVVTQCPSCDTCSLDDVGCTAFDHCSRPCEVGGKIASCAERTRWSAQNLFHVDKDPCSLGHKRTLEECMDCSDCPLEATDCSNKEARTMSGPLSDVTLDKFQCHSGDDPSGWSTDKVDWCCKNKRLGCPIPTSQPYNCAAGFHNWQTSWSVFKKAWCCANQERGCPKKITTQLPTPEYHDCSSGLFAWRTSWSSHKQAWCCKHQGIGCAKTTQAPMILHDCVAGFAHWREAWDSRKKNWCCKQKELGCETMKPGDPFDCSTGLCSEWPGEKTWWCNAKKRGSCPMLPLMKTTTSKPYDCTAELHKWKDGWSYEKKDWCCNNEELGCPMHTPHNVNFVSKNLAKVGNNTGLEELLTPYRFIPCFIVGSLVLAVMLMVIRGLSRRSYAKLRQRDLTLTGSIFQ